MKFEEILKKYFIGIGIDPKLIEKLGSGLVAEAYKVVYQDGKVEKTVVCRRLKGTGMSQDYLSDKVGYLLLQHHIANGHPKHIKSIDVVGVFDTYKSISIEGIKDVFQIMNYAHGESYLSYIGQIKDGFNQGQQKIVTEICDYMKMIHSIKLDNTNEKEDERNFYLRHSQDFIGSEVLMDILDSWPVDSLLPITKRAKIIKKNFEIRECNKEQYSRTRLIHSDLHPDNIRVNDDLTINVLDSARTIWGEPMDDVTSMLANYIFFGLKHSESMGNYESAYNLVLERYFEGNINNVSNELSRVFLKVRLIILSHPIFFDKDDLKLKKKNFEFGV